MTLLNIVKSNLCALKSGPVPNINQEKCLPLQGLKHS